MKTYFYKYQYDDNKSKGWTGRLTVEANEISDSYNKAIGKAKEERPEAFNFRNFKLKG